MDALHLVQRYIDTKSDSRRLSKPFEISSLHRNNRKRKSPGSEPASRELSLGTGLLTPSTSSHVERSSSASSSTSDVLENGAEIYNGMLEKREGLVVTKKVRFFLDRLLHVY